MSVKDERLLVTIRRGTLNEFWSRETGMVKGNLTMVNMLGVVMGNELVLKTWLPTMVPFPLVDDVGMILAFTTVIYSLRK